MPTTFSIILTLSDKHPTGPFEQRPVWHLPQVPDGMSAPQQHTFSPPTNSSLHKKKNKTKQVSGKNTTNLLIF